MLATPTQPLFSTHICFVVLIAFGTLGLETRVQCADALSTTVSDTPEGDAVLKKEIEKYSGVWKVISITTNGETTFEDERLILVENTIDGAWFLTIDGEEKMHGTYHLSPLANPKEIDLKITSGDGQGGTLKGIYETTENTRRLCVRGPAAWRPQEFTGATGTDCALVEFKRQVAHDAE